MKTIRYLLAAGLLSSAACADITVQHFFTNALSVAESELTTGTGTPPPAGAIGHFDEYSDEIPLDATESDDRFHLYKYGNYTSEIVDEPTGLAGRWLEFLQHGFFRGQNATSWSDACRSGMATEQVAYQVLHSNRGSATECTIYMVFRPQPDLGWAAKKRNALFGLGNSSSQWLTCWKSDKDENLTLDYTSKANGVESHYRLTIEQEWNPERWYFVAASFPSTTGEGVQCNFYLREMHPKGPMFSPEGKVGQLVTGDGFFSYYPNGKNGFPFGRWCKLGIGCQYLSDGSKWRGLNSLGGDIAYFRGDNTFQTVEDFENVFLSLSVIHDPRTLLLIQ